MSARPPYNRRRRHPLDTIPDILLYVLYGLVVLGVVALIFFVASKIPCQFYSLSPDVPGRCYSYFNNN